ncbi:MAG: ferric reductase [Pseudomonadota bacterium]
MRQLTAYQTFRLVIWMAIASAIAFALMTSARSPLLQWRDPIYQLASFAGIGALVLMIFQPLSAVGFVPGFSQRAGRRIHFFLGVAVVALVIVHVGALWVTSPPDVIDALLFVSPTQFSIWGVGAMWAIFGAALVTILRRSLSFRYRTWSRLHVALVSVAVAGTVVHIALIDGLIETVAKIAICVVVVGTLLVSLVRRRRRT